MKTKELYNKILILGLIYYFLEVFFLEWFCMDNSIKYCSIIIFACAGIGMLLAEKKCMKIDKKTLLFVFIFIIYILINLLVSTISANILSKIVYYMITPISIYLFGLMCTKNEEIDKKYLRNVIPKFLNIYFFINVPILILQCQGTGFMMRNFTSSYSNQFYTDHISGLLGLDGTHKLGLFFIAALLGNIYMILKTKKKRYYLIFIFELIFSFVLSLFNDNKAIFLILPLVLITVLFNTFGKSRKIKTMNIVCVLLVILFIGTIIVNYSDSVSTFFNENVTYLFNQDSEHNLKEQERTYVVKYALEEGNGYYLGKGIECTYPKLEPKAHFGINDMSSLIYEGGLIYLVLWIIMLCSILYKYIPSQKRNIKVKICCYLWIVVFLYYSQIIINWKQVFLVSLIFLMYRNILLVGEESSE